MNYFDLSNDLMDSKQKDSKLKKIQNLFSPIFENFLIKDMENNFEEIIILNLIRSSKIRIQEIIEKLYFINLKNNYSEGEYFNEFVNLFINNIFIFTFLLVLKFKYHITFNQNNNHRLQSFYEAIINLEYFNELKNNETIIQSYISNIYIDYNCEKSKKFEQLKKLYNIYQNSFKYFIDIYLKPNLYSEKVDYEKNLNFVFTENEENSLWKSYMMLCLNRNIFNNQTDSNLKFAKNENQISEYLKDSTLYFNIVFEENILKDFIIFIRDHKVFSGTFKKLRSYVEIGKAKSEEKINNSFIHFHRHINLTEKISEIFKIDENSKIMIYGPSSSGKTTFIRNFTKNELLIDVDESLEVNV